MASTALPRQTSGARLQQKHYTMPSVSGDPPVIHEPARQRYLPPGQKDVMKSVNVSEFYEWVSSRWNEENPANKMELLDNCLTSSRRNTIHKRQIASVLVSKIPEMYGKLTYGMSCKQDHTSMQQSLQTIMGLPDLSVYVKHSHCGWLVRNLVEQRMETASRAARSKKKTSTRRGSEQESEVITEYAGNIEDVQKQPVRDLLESSATASRGCQMARVTVPDLSTCEFQIAGRAHNLQVSEPDDLDVTQAFTGHRMVRGEQSSDVEQHQNGCLDNFPEADGIDDGCVQGAYEDTPEDGGVGRNRLSRSGPSRYQSQISIADKESRILALRAELAVLEEKTMADGEPVISHDNADRGYLGSQRNSLQLPRMSSNVENGRVVQKKRQRLAQHKVPGSQATASRVTFNPRRETYETVARRYSRKTSTKRRGRESGILHPTVRAEDNRGSERMSPL